VIESKISTAVETKIPTEESVETNEPLPDEKTTKLIRRGRPRIKEKPSKSLKNVIEEYEKIDFNEKDFDRLVAMLDTKNAVKCTQALVGLSKLFLREEGNYFFFKFTAPQPRKVV
jgi:hypothetical protein